MKELYHEAVSVPGAAARGERPCDSGASLAWTSDDPVVIGVRRLFDEGRFAEAEQVLQASLADADADSRRARGEMLDILSRARHEYGLDVEALLAKLRPIIPDITTDDIERWREAGQVQHRIIDGAVCYFRREPANLWRFCDEARRRRDEHAARVGKPEESSAQQSGGPSFHLEEHLAQIITTAQATGRAEVLPIRHRIRYTVTVKPDRPGARAGSILRVWLPFPQQWGQQRGVKLVSAAPQPYLVAPNAVEGEPMGGAPQRTIYFERQIEDPSQAQAFRVEFEYVTSAYDPDLRDELAKPLPADFPRRYLAERPPHIVFTTELKGQVNQIIAGETNPLARARRIFHWIDGNIAYCAEQEYATVPGYAAKAFTARRGDCGIKAFLFITMCRYAGVPARWQSGWETKRVGWNMHDWAEFYVKPWGWLPADPSYGLRNPDPQPAKEGEASQAGPSLLASATAELREQVRQFYFGHQDSYRLIVNVDYGTPLHPPKESLRSDPTDFQRGEIEIDGRNLYFEEWDWSMEPAWEELD